MTDPNYTNYGPKPKRKIVTIGLETFQLVNWFDYRGWEVRKFEAQNDALTDPFAPTLGWVSQLERADGANVWQVRLPGATRSEDRTFTTRAKAVLSISGLLDADDEDALPATDRQPRVGTYRD